MKRKHILARLGTAFLLPAVGALGDTGTPLFTDRFDGGLEHWVSQQPDHIAVLEEPGSPGNRLMQLTPRDGDFMHALLRGSDGYRNVRLEGDMLFPTGGDGYLGLIFNYQEHDGRADFGVIYVKSNSSYLRVSPHYDNNPSWRLFEELKVPLDGGRRIKTSHWYHFRLDVAENVAALYLGGDTGPALVFGGFEMESGALGLEARPGAGDPVWVDNVQVSSLPADYEPPAEAAIAYAPGAMIRQWQVAGPLTPLEGAPSHELPDVLSAARWRGFDTDARGMVRSGRVTEYLGERRVAWFCHRFDFDPSATSSLALALSTANRISVWLNGAWVVDVPRQSYAWFDFLNSAEHAGATVPLRPLAGENTLLLRVDGDVFAAGGFYAALISDQ
jgi:hypothetical protein